MDFIDRPMQGTEFSRQEKDEPIALTCPWGNDIRAYGPGFGTSLGIPFAVVDVPKGNGAIAYTDFQGDGGRDSRISNGDAPGNGAIAYTDSNGDAGGLEALGLATWPTCMQPTARYGQRW